MPEGYLTEDEILGIVEEQWGIQNPTTIALKVGEEAGEVQGAVVKMGEGRAGVEHLKAEIGDALIALSSLAARHGLSDVLSIRDERLREKQEEWEEYNKTREKNG